MGQGVKLIEEAANIAPGGVGIGHDPQPNHPPPQAGCQQQALEFARGDGLVPEAEAAISGQMEADHPLGLGTLQPALGQQHQAQREPTERRGQHAMGNGLQLQHPHQPTPGEASSTGRDD